MRWFLCLLGMASQLIGGAAFAVPAYAQAIAPDGTLPTHVASPDGLNFTITGGSQVGGNLFHSFRQLSVPTLGSASFSFAPTAGIQTIISRVTGGSPSTIDGAINTTSPVNVFLINPSGIVFGPNASLNIGGSFISSTANSLTFADGSEFKASSDQPAPLLTMSVPVGLQYSGGAAPIQVQGSVLAVAPNQTLALVGGEVTMSGGTLQAPSGRIELGGVNAGTVGVTVSGTQWQLSYPPALTRANVTLTNGALVTTSGDGGGNIQLVAKQLTVQDSRVEANTLGSVSGGSLTVNVSDAVVVTGSDTSGTFAQGLFAENYGDGNASGLTVTTNQLLVQGEVRLSTIDFGPGRGGALTVNAADSVELVGVDSPDYTLFTGLVADTYGSGLGGNVTVNTERLTVRDGAIVSATSYGVASASTITVNATQSLALVGASPSDISASALIAVAIGAGNAGSILVNTRHLSILDGATIFAGTSSTGNGGSVMVNATNAVEVSGVSPIFKIPGGIFSIANPDTTGQAGAVTLNTRQLTVQNGGIISAQTYGLGQGGTLTINASDAVQISGQGPLRDDPLTPGSQIPTFSSLSASVLNPANTQSSGDVIINAGGLLSIQGGARVTVDNEGTGRGGSINVQAQSVLINNLGGDPNNPGGMRAVTASGEGGNISLQLRNLLLMQNGSLISTDAAGGSGNGGNINLQAAILAAFNNSDITANAVQGRGGGIQIAANAIIGTQYRPALTPESDITASSRFGASGVVDIRTPDVDPTRGVTTLPIQLVDATKLIAQGCRTSPGKEASRFTISGRGGLPPSPEDILASDAVIQDVRVAPIQVSRDRPSTAITQAIPQPSIADPIEAQGLVQTAHGEIFLATQVASVSPSSPWVAPLSCDGH